MKLHNLKGKKKNSLKEAAEAKGTMGLTCTWLYIVLLYQNGGF